MAKASPQLICIIGRGHSGTRVLAHTLYASGVWMGHRINPAGDCIPAKPMYEACKRPGRYVEWTGGLSWDFDPLHSMDIEPEFGDLVKTYLRGILTPLKPLRGWKLPETILAYPWIARMFPQAKFLHIVRDPRDCLLAPHLTDDLRRCGVACPETDNILDRRVASWKYQQDIVTATPRPDNFMSIRFEDFVLNQDTTLRQLEEFLEFPLARIVVDKKKVGLWRSDLRLLEHIEPLANDMRALAYD